MDNRNDRSGGPEGEVRRPNPDNAATDPNAAAQQDRMRADHDALQESARRVDASAPNGGAAIDREAADTQDRVHAEHDRMQESARRVEASVPADVRDTPIQAANLGTTPTEDNSQAVRDSNSARDNADAARQSAREVQQSVPHEADRNNNRR